MKNQRDTSKYTLTLPLLQKVERLAAERPTEIVSVWGTNLRCYYSSPSSSSVPGGFTAEEMIGRHASEFVHVRDMAHLALTRSDVELTGKSIEMTVDIRNKFKDLIRMRSRAILEKDPLSGKTFFVIRSVPDGEQLSDLDEL